MREDLEQRHEQNERIRADCESQRFTLALQRNAMRQQQNHMPTKRPPRDANELAKYILDVTTGETEKIEPPKKNPHAQALSKLGASKGGNARAKALTARKRKQIAQKAAKTRWKRGKR